MTITDERLLDDLGELLDTVEPVPATVPAEARAAFASGPDLVIATVQQAINRLLSHDKLAYGWRQNLAAVLTGAIEREKAFRSDRIHDGAPAAPEPGDEIYLAHVVSAALTPQPPARTPKADAS
jgi:hypothetical protein